MRKSLLTIALVALACGSAAARSLSPSEALARALNSENISGALRAPSRAVPVMTVGTEEQPAVYVFDQGAQGYLIVSADDVAAPVLAYSDSGTFDPDNMPESLRWWLGEYKTQIEAASKAKAESYEKVNRAERKPVEPLLTTVWNQEEPFNNSCPELYGRQTVTGCIATAMAQVMNYHEWPKSFDADFSYDWIDGAPKLTWDQKGVEFDWENMMDSYNGKYQSIHANAVATLMKACGYSVKMRYGLEASLASSTNISEALVKYFNYDRGVYYTMRSHHSLDEWEDIIYNELLNKRPVIYSGRNYAGGGHSFVCDGYNGDGFFHFNWGWGGTSDGNFLLTALNPDAQGVGGSASGYTDEQSIVLGISKPGAMNEESTPSIICDGILSAKWSGNSIIFEAIKPNGGGFFNMTNREITGNFGVQFVDDKGNVVKNIFWAAYKSATIPVSEGFKSITVKCTSAPKGKYNIHLIFQTSTGEIIKIGTTVDQAGYFIYNSNGNTITTPETWEYSVADLKIETPMYENSQFLVSGKAMWTGPKSVNTPIVGVLMTGTTAETIIAFGEKMSQEFPSNSNPAEFNYITRWISTTVDEYSTTGIPAGDYYFAMAINQDDGNKLLSSPISVTIQNHPGYLEMQESNLVIPDQNAVDPDNFNISFDATCQNGYFFDYYTIKVIDFNSSPEPKLMAKINTPIHLIGIGETRKFNIKDVIPNAKSGDKYQVQIFRGSSLILWADITIGDKSGISDVIADGNVMAKACPNPAVDYSVITASDEILRVDLISLSGTSRPVPADINGQSARIDVSAIPTGLYIARVSTASGVETVKIVKM